MDASLDPERLLFAYAAGIFPMADEGGTLHWLAPDPRAIIELDRFRVSRSLRTRLRRGTFTVTVNRSFAVVVAACADRTEGTWISPDIVEAYSTLHRHGFAHSVETWRADRLVGGLYGVALGGAFFGESMFHRETDASKVAMVHLVERMRQGRFELLDVQFMTEHLRSLGAVEVPRVVYERRLHRAVRLRRSFTDAPGAKPPKSEDEPPDA